MVADTETAVLCSLEGGGIADQNCFGHNFYFIADTDTEIYYFRIISAMISDRRYWHAATQRSKRASEKVWKGF